MKFIRIRLVNFDQSSPTKKALTGLIFTWILVTSPLAYGTPKSGALIDPTIQVQSVSGKAQVISDPVDEKYLAADTQGNSYILRLKNELPNYADLGVTELTEYVGLPALKMRPILLKRGEQGVPLSSDAQGLNPANRNAGRMGAHQDWFAATLQEKKSRKSFDAQNLTGQQLAELAGHFLIAQVVGNPAIQPGDGVSGPLAYDGSHFYLADASQSFLLHINNKGSQNLLETGFQKLLKDNPSLFSQMNAENRQQFTENLNQVLTQLERLNQKDFDHFLSPYFKNASSSVNFHKEILSRVKEARSDLITFLKNQSFSASELAAPATNAPTSPLSTHSHLTQPDLAEYYNEASFKKRALILNRLSQELNTTPDQAISKMIEKLNPPLNVAIPVVVEKPAEKPIEKMIEKPVLQLATSDLSLPSEKTKLPLAEVKNLDSLLSNADNFIDRNYPNYFKKTRHSSEDLKRQINETVRHIVDHLKVPYSVDGKIHFEGLFNHLQKSVPHADVYLSGGVVRSILGYIYDEIRTAQRDPRPSLRPSGQRDTYDILEEIKSRKMPFEATQVLGIGSDLDVLIEPHPGHERESAFMIEKAVVVVNSARRHLKIEGDRDPFVATLVPDGDVRVYTEQTQRAVRNGGVSLDFLAYNLNKHQLKEPQIEGEKKDFHIMDSYLDGHYVYTQGSHPEDHDTTLIRALRHPLEQGFLRASPDSEERLREDLEKVLKRGSISSLAQKQFPKGVRNSRSGGASNRYFESEETLDQLSQKIFNQFGEKFGKFPALFRFLINQDIAKRQPLKEDPLAQLVIPAHEYEKKFAGIYTNHGTLYHATPDPTNILCMMRNGLAPSGGGQGQAQDGRGFYCTSNLETINKYDTVDGSTGAVLSFKIKEPEKVRILDYKDPRVQKDPFIKGLMDKYKNNRDGLFEELANKYQVDIILNGDFPLIQNSGVLEYPKSMEDVLGLFSEQTRSAFNALDQKKNDFMNKEELVAGELAFAARRLKNYQSFEKLESALKQTSVDNLARQREWIDKGMTHLIPEMRAAFNKNMFSDHDMSFPRGFNHLLRANELFYESAERAGVSPLYTQNYQEFHKKGMEVLKEAIRRGKHSDMIITTSDLLNALQPKGHSSLSELLELTLKSKSPANMGYSSCAFNSEFVGKYLAGMEPLNNSLYQDVLSALRSSTTDRRLAAACMLKDLGKYRPEFRSAILKQILTEDSPAVLKALTDVIVHQRMSFEEIAPLYRELVQRLKDKRQPLAVRTRTLPTLNHLLYSYDRNFDQLASKAMMSIVTDLSEESSIRAATLPQIRFLLPGEKEKNVDVLLALLRDDAPNVREATYLFLKNNFRYHINQKYLDSLLDLLKDQTQLENSPKILSKMNNFNALLTLIVETHYTQEPELKNVIEKLSKLYKPENQQLLCKSFADLFKSISWQNSILVDLIQKSNPSHRLVVIELAGCARPEDEVTQKEFVREMENSDPAIRQAAASALLKCSLGKYDYRSLNNVQVVPKILGLLKHPNTAIREEAKKLVQQLGISQKLNENEDTKAHGTRLNHYLQDSCAQPIHNVLKPHEFEEILKVFEKAQ